MDLIITIVFSLFIIGYFVFHWQKLSTLKFGTESKSHREILKEYNRSIGKIIPDRTAIPAEKFFSIEKFFNECNINYNLTKSVPNALVGMGILGTFAGLAISFLNVDLQWDNTESTLETIKSLIGGMKTAFWSSLFGMLTSLIFGIIFKQKLNELQKHIKSTCKELDEQNLSTPIHVLAGFSNNIGNSIGGQIASQLETLIIGITENVKEQMFEAGNCLTSGAETLQKTINELNLTVKVFSNSVLDIKKTVSSVDIKEIDNALSEFGDFAVQIQEASKAAENALTNAKQAMKENIEVFSKITYKQYETAQIYQSTKNDINGNIKSISDQIEELKSITFKLHESIGSVKDIQPDIQKIFNEIRNGIIDYIEILKNETNGLVCTYTNEFTKACESINSTTAQLDETCSKMSSTVEDSAQKIATAANNLSKTLKQ